MLSALRSWVAQRALRHVIGFSHPTPRDPESLRRQCELHAVVHSQLDPQVVEMVPTVAGAMPSRSPSSRLVRPSVASSQQLHLPGREVAQHGRTAPLRLLSSGGGITCSPACAQTCIPPGRRGRLTPREGPGPYDSPRLLDSLQGPKMHVQPPFTLGATVRVTQRGGAWTSRRRNGD